MKRPAMQPGRFVETFGRLHLAENLHDAGYSCAEPLIDIGVDLIAFKDGRYRTLQLKAATNERFGLERKYEGRVDVMVYVFHARSAKPEIYAMTYAEAEAILEARGHTKSASWEKKGYSLRPGPEVKASLAQYLATPARWRELLA